MDKKGGPVKLEYLDSGSNDCPLVRLYDLEPQGTSTLVRHFYDLSTRAIDSLESHALSGVAPADDLRLMAVVGKERGLVLLGPGLNFEMTLSQASWDQVAGLAEPFEVLTSGGRHQWADKAA